MRVDDPSQSILDVSIANKIAHWRECGGNGRCSTCRIRVLDGLANLTPRTEAENRMAESREFGPAIRLACQTRVLGDVTFERLVLHGSSASQLQLETIPEGVGEERDLALLICDMRGFTPFVDSHSPFDVVHILNRMFDALGEAILINGGAIYQYVGDEISGLFGLDGKSPETACRAAIRSALGMIDALESLNTSLESEFGTRLSVGIGVHFGPVIVGRVGHPTRRDFSVVGDSINVASRIQGMNKQLGTRVLVSTEVLQILPLEAVDIGKETETLLRGKGEPVSLHEVKGFLEPDSYLTVQGTMKHLFEGPESFADQFYPRLFRASPELEALFTEGTRMQGGMLEHMLQSVVHSLSRPEHLALGLHTLGRRHQRYGVTHAHYDLFRQPMLDTIAHFYAGEPDGPRVIEAWSAVLDTILGLLRAGSAGSPAATD